MKKRLALLAFPAVLAVATACVPQQVDPALIRNPDVCASSVLNINDGSKLPCVLAAGTVVNVRLSIVVPPGTWPTPAQTAAANARGAELGAVTVTFYPGSDPYAGFFSAENVDHSKVTT